MDFLSWKKWLWRLLWPIRLVVAFLYGLVIRLRNLLYDLRVFSVNRLTRPVISIGNLTLGGTGKTPFTLYLIEYLQQKGLKVGYISRGYGRSTRGPQEVRLEEAAPAIRYGDEAVQVKLRFPNLPTFVGENRYQAGQALLRAYPDTQVLLLDDAFQHRRVHRDIDIVLMDMANLPWHDWLFPLGRLREPLSCYQRAHLLILNQKHYTEKKRRTRFPDKPVARFVYEVWDLWHPVRGSLSTETIRHKPVMAFCGIAVPDSFKVAIQSIPAYVTELLTFRDHHVYRGRDLDEIRRRFRRLQKRLGMKDLLLLTTEKDLARLYQVPHAQLLDELPLYAMRIRMSPLNPDEALKLQNLILPIPAYGHA
jgi:tetraacyldisaccharide 4'-kinase